MAHRFIPKRRKPERMGLRTPPQVRCDSHLKWIRGNECAIAGKNGHVCTGKVRAAHTRTGTNGGGSLKPGDNWTIPLCDGAHGEQHSSLVGERRFEAKYGISMKAIAEALWRISPHRRRYEETRERPVA